VLLVPDQQQQRDAALNVLIRRVLKSPAGSSIRLSEHVLPTRGDEGANESAADNFESPLLHESELIEEAMRESLAEVLKSDHSVVLCAFEDPKTNLECVFAIQHLMDHWQDAGPAPLVLVLSNTRLPPDHSSRSQEDIEWERAMQRAGATIVEPQASAVCLLAARVAFPSGGQAAKAADDGLVPLMGLNYNLVEEEAVVEPQASRSPSALSLSNMDMASVRSDQSLFNFVRGGSDRDMLAPPSPRFNLVRGESTQSLFASPSPMRRLTVGSYSGRGMQTYAVLPSFLCPAAAFFCLLSFPSPMFLSDSNVTV
jgi:hypothetical protein